MREEVKTVNKSEKRSVFDADPRVCGKQTVTCQKFRFEVTGNFVGKVRFVKRGEDFVFLGKRSGETQKKGPGHFFEGGRRRLKAT